MNTDEGRNTSIHSSAFAETYALKLDYAGRKNYASIILSQKDSKNTLGYFGGWTLSDAILIYAEGSLTQGSNALYPRKNHSYLGASMQQIRQDDQSIEPVILVGSSYTLETSGTFSLEYVYNASGYSDGEAGIYYNLRQKGAAAFNIGGMVGTLGQKTLAQTANPGLKYLRKNYVMLQYSQGNIKNKIDLTLRWTQNLDDGSGQFLSLVSYSLGNHLELFSSGMLNAGGKNTEFGSVLNYQVMIGVKYTL
jgi:hypothetical protein